MQRKWRVEQVVYDTSALMLIVEGIPVFDLVEELLETKPECIILESVKRELEKHVTSRSVRKRIAARLALQAAERRGCKVVKFGEGRLADDDIIEYVVRNSSAIAVTADAELHRRLLKLGIPHIYYREEGRRFEATGL